MILILQYEVLNTSCSPIFRKENYLEEPLYVINSRRLIEIMDDNLLN